VLGKKASLQIGVARFSWYNIPKRKKNIPITTKYVYQMAFYNIYQIVVKLIKWPYSLPTFFIARRSRMYPYLDFWFENIRSGNPAANILLE
jgi:hypothetical protein